MPPAWECCNCRTGPQLFANGKTCPTCQHRCCLSCRRDDKIRPPVQPRKVQMVYYVSGKPSNDHVSHRAKAQCDSRTDYTGRLPDPQNLRGLHKQIFRLGAQQDMRGWWKCHMCANNNNPALCPQKCGGCEHIRCRACTRVTWGGN